MNYTYYECPVGPLLLVGDADGLAHIDFPSEVRPTTIDAQWTRAHAPFTPVIEQLDAYFAGDLRTFTIELNAQGTDFQRAVWSVLEGIPFGCTWSYADVARHIGRPKAVRAVGAANGANPLPVIVPCHRVIGSSGKLTGFGGGLAAKRWLLQHEGALSATFDFC